VILPKRPLFIASALAALTFGSACGPFGYIGRVATDASRAVADAEAAGGEEFAPYEYWGSVAYLEQSKVMMAYSEYERSFDYGDRAKQLAEAAKQKSDRTSQGVTVEHKEGVAAPDDMVDAEGEATGEAGGGKAEGEAKVGVSVGGDK
jgi:hypothetical protein